MNFFGYLGKTKGSGQDSDLPETNLEEKQIISESRKKHYTKRIKRLLHLDSTKESLSDNELLTYVHYDIKLHDLLYKSGKNQNIKYFFADSIVFLGIGCAIFGRIIIKKMKFNLTRRSF